MTLKTPENQAIVIFGATGDLTGRKLMPALSSLFVQSLLPNEFAVIGYGRSEMTGDEFREASAAHVAKYSRTGLDPETWEAFAAHLDYVPGEFGAPGAMHHLAERVEGGGEAGHRRGRRPGHWPAP